MSRVSKLSVELLEKSFQDYQEDLRKLPRRVISRVVSLYLQLECVATIESTHLSRVFNIKEYINTYPEDFYFSNPSHVYVRNLVLLNTALVIDDLVVRCLSQIHGSKESNRLRHIECLFYILKYRTFCRRTLRLIFDNLVYFDADDNFYRFGVLDLIIKRYKESDVLMACGSALSHPSHLECACYGTDDLCNDNVMVLANIIWEEVRGYLDTDVIHEQSATEFADESSLFVHRDVLLREFSYPDIERMCIMELLGTIVDCTGNFFCNRIAQNQMLLEKLKELPGIVKLLDKMVANFERLDLLSGTFLRILEKKNTKQSRRLLSALGVAHS